MTSAAPFLRERVRMRAMSGRTLHHSSISFGGESRKAARHDGMTSAAPLFLQERVRMRAM